MDSETYNSMQSAFRQGRYADVLAMAERYLSEVDIYDWQAMIMKANVLATPYPSFSDYYTAVGLAFVALEQDRSDPERWLAVGAICDCCGLYAQTEQCYRTVLEMEPDSYYAILGLASNYRSPGTNISVSEARSFLERAIESKPEEWQPYHHLAHLLRKSGENDAAIDMYRKALEVYPQDKTGDTMYRQITEELKQLSV